MEINDTLLSNVHQLLVDVKAQVPQDYNEFKSKFNPETSANVHQLLVDIKAQVPQDYNEFVSKIGYTDFVKKKVGTNVPGATSPESGSEAPSTSSNASTPSISTTEAGIQEGLVPEKAQGNQQVPWAIGASPYEEKVQKAKTLRRTGQLNKDGSISTVKFTSYEQDGKHYVVPTLFPKDPDSTSSDPKDWTELEFKDAVKEAEKRGEVFEFDSEAEAQKFAEGDWKGSKATNAPINKYINPEAIAMANDLLWDTKGVKFDALKMRLATDEELDEFNSAPENQEILQKERETFQANRELLEDVLYNIPKENRDMELQRGSDEFSEFMYGYKQGRKGEQQAKDDTRFIAAYADDDGVITEHFEREFIRAMARTENNPELLSKEGLGTLIGGQVGPIIRVGGVGLLASLFSFNPIAGAAAAGTVGAVDAAETGFGAAYRQYYFQSRTEGRTPEEAHNTALKLAWYGAATAGAEGALGAIPGFGKIAGKITSNAIAKPITKVAMDLAVDMGAASVGQVVNNKAAQAEGLDVGTFDGVQENALAEGLFSLGVNVSVGLYKTPGAIRAYANKLDKKTQDALAKELIKTQAKMEADAGRSVSSDFINDRKAQLERNMDNGINADKSAKELGELDSDPIAYAKKERDSLQMMLDRGKVPEDQVSGIKDDIAKLDIIIQDLESKPKVEPTKTETDETTQEEGLQDEAQEVKTDVETETAADDVEIAEADIQALEADVSAKKSEGMLSDNVGEIIYNEKGERGTIKRTNKGFEFITDNNKIYEYNENVPLYEQGLTKEPPTGIDVKDRKNVRIKGKDYEITSARRKGDGWVIKAKEVLSDTEQGRKYGVTRRLTGDDAEVIAKDLALQKIEPPTPKAKVADVKPEPKADAKPIQTEEELSAVPDDELEIILKQEEAFVNEYEKALIEEAEGKVSDLDYLFVESEGKEYAVRKYKAKGEAKYTIIDVKTNQPAKGDIRTKIEAAYETARNKEEARIVSEAATEAGKARKQSEDKVLKFLDKAIEATSGKGKMFDATLGLPMFVANSSFKVIRSAYKAGKALSEAIADGIAYLKERGYSVNETKYKEAFLAEINKARAGATKLREDAVQKQKAGEVPVQPEGRGGEKVPETQSKTEPKEPPKEGEVPKKEVAQRPGRVTGQKIVVNDWVEFKRSLRERGKASREGYREGKKQLGDLAKSFQAWVKDNKSRLSYLKPTATKAMLDRVSSIKTEKQLERAIKFVENVLTKKEYYDNLRTGEKARAGVKRFAKASKGKNIFGDHYNLMQDVLRINPESLQPSQLDVYNKYMIEAYMALRANSRIPDVKPIRELYAAFEREILISDESVKKLDSVTTIGKALADLSQVESIESIQDYRSVLSKVRQIEYHSRVLLAEGKINDEQYQAIMDDLDVTYRSTEDMSLEQMTDEFKDNLIAEAKRNSKYVINTWEGDKGSKVEEFLDIPVYALDDMSIKDIDSYNRAMGMLEDGVVGSEMYEIIRKANVAKVKLPLIDFFDGVANNPRFKKLRNLGLDDLRKAFLTAKSERMDLDLFGSIGNRALKRAYFTPMDDAISKASSRESEILKNYIAARDKIRKKIRMTPSKMERLDKELGFLLSLRDWMSNRVAHTVNGVKKEYDWDDAPDEIKNKWDYVFKRVKEDRSSTMSLQDIMSEEDIWLELKDKYKLTNLKQVEAAIEAKRKASSDIANYIDASQQVLADIKGVVQVATEERGKLWEERDGYFPAMTKDVRQNPTEDIFASIDNAIGKMSGGRLSVEAGSTNRRTNLAYYTEVDLSKVLQRATSEALTDFYVTPAMRGSLVGLSRAGDATNNALIARELNNAVLERIKYAVNKRQIEEAERYFNKVMTYTKWMTLARPERPVFELLANGFRSLVSEGVINYKKGYDAAYQSILKKGVIDDKFSQYQEELGDRRLDQSKLKTATRGLITFADSVVGKATFAKVFDREFKKLTGETFNSDKYISDPRYRKDYADEIASAKVDAMSRVEELFNSKAPLSAPTHVSFFGSKALRKDNPMVSMLYYMQSFNDNERQQIRDSFIRIGNRKSTLSDRIKGFRDIVAITGSNTIYMQGLLFTNVVYRALIQDLFDEDEKSAVIEAVDKHVDDNLNPQTASRRLGSSLLSVATGKYSNVSRLMISFGLSYLDESAKQGGWQDEQWYKEQREALGQVMQVAFYARPIPARMNVNQALSMFIPGVGQTIGSAIDAGYDIVKIASTPKEELIDDYEKYLADVIQIMNLAVSGIMMNPVSPILNKMSNYAEFETEYMAGKLLKYDDTWGDDITNINGIVRRNELYDDSGFKKLKSLQKDYYDAKTDRERKALERAINQLSPRVLKSLNQKEMEAIMKANK